MQTEPYNCYYFDFGNIRNEMNSTNTPETDIFVGFSNKKYVKIYLIQIMMYDQYA